MCNYKCKNCIWVVFCGIFLNEKLNKIFIYLLKLCELVYYGDVINKYLIDNCDFVKIKVISIFCIIVYEF